MKSEQGPGNDVAGPLRREDWDFSDVPNEELVACCYWEYARESEFICETLRRYRESRDPGFNRQTESSDSIGARMERIQSIGDVSEVILRGCAVPPGIDWQSVNPYSRSYRHPEAPPISGNFPTPWQSLSHPERTYRSRIAIYGDRLVPPAIERGDHWEAEDIAKHCRARWDEIFAAYHQIQDANPGKSEVQLIEEGKLQPWTEITPSLFWESGREVTLVRISWAEYTNDELVQYFRRWVKASRPKELPVLSRQGHKPGDWRAHLTRLATMRLLGRLKPSEILASRSKLASEIWESKQFKRRKWMDTTKWHDARREAAQIFCRMFPFLPPEEKPRSWLRKEPGK